MTIYSREQILEKAGLLGKEIAKQEEIILYQKAEQQINRNKRVQDLITEIKRKQQELVNAKHLKRKNYVQLLEAELDALNQELHGIPLVDQYQNSQAELNKYIQFLLQVIKDEVSVKLPIDDEI